MLEALVGHLVGDFLLQNDYQALNKKQRTWPCLVHCLLWTLSVAAFSWFWHPVWLLGLFLSHFVQDRTDIIRCWMMFNGQKEFATGKLAPWSIIVVDQVWHIVTIFVLWKLLHA